MEYPTFKHAAKAVGFGQIFLAMMGMFALIYFELVSEVKPDANQEFLSTFIFMVVSSTICIALGFTLLDGIYKPNEFLMICWTGVMTFLFLAITISLGAVYEMETIPDFYKFWGTVADILVLFSLIVVIKYQQSVKKGVAEKLKVPGIVLPLNNFATIARDLESLSKIQAQFKFGQVVQKV